MTSQSLGNPYLAGSISRLFLRTATPIVAIMLLNGLYVIVDAWFLGAYVGAAALSAVTLLFPALMAMLALQALVASGMASILARRLGAGEAAGALSVVVSARRLALVIAALLNLFYWTVGRDLIPLAAGGDGEVARLAEAFMAVAVVAQPVAMFLAVEIDRLRCEGRIATMTRITVAAALLNILLNWLMIAVLGLGAAGSALSSASAQAACLAAVLTWRRRHAAGEAMESGRPSLGDMRGILALGAPASLGFLGISLASAAIIVNLARWQTVHYVETVAAYGIVTRILSFAYLPLMGLGLAFQTICGNNLGAGERRRVAESLAIAVVSAFFYCLAVEALIVLAAGPIGRAFSGDALVAAEFVRIIPWMLAVYVLFGPVMMLGAYFQAIGDAGRAALFGLARPYLLSIPLTFLLPFFFGEPGIWRVALFAETGMLALTALVMMQGRRRGLPYGLLPR